MADTERAALTSTRQGGDMTLCSPRETSTLNYAPGNIQRKAHDITGRSSQFFFLIPYSISLQHGWLLNSLLGRRIKPGFSKNYKSCSKWYRFSEYCLTYVCPVVDVRMFRHSLLP